MNIRRGLLAAIALGACGIGLFFAAGQLVARNATQTCAASTIAHLAANPQIGLGFHGERISVGPEDATAEVAGPFQVVTRYSVPRDLHASIHTRHYWAFPWGCRLRKSEVFDLVFELFREDDPIV